MSENDDKSNTFADAIAKIYEPLNNEEKFKEKFGDNSFTILLNPKDDKFAALITVNKGQLSVKSIENSSKKNLSQNILGWDGFMQTTTELFKAIGRGELSSGDIAKKVMTRKIKVKNPNILIKFSQLGALLRD